MTTTADAYSADLRRAMDTIELALPAPGDELGQDEEWVVVKVDGEWRKIRLHNYDEVFVIPGLYEKWVYEIFQCQSPVKIRELLERGMKAAGDDPAALTVLDLGAGNGCVADELRSMGLRRFVGIDIYPEAREAAERDRPGLYEDYVVSDMTDLDPESVATMDRHAFGALTCVAALGFGDIPPAVFAAAFNRVEDGGWVAFTIKEDFLDEKDDSGFSRLIRRMMAGGVLELVDREAYRHRIATDGADLIYEAFVGRKRSDIPADWKL